MNNFKGHKHTEESKKKMSESHKGKSSWNKGKKCSEETKEKMRLAKLKNPVKFWKGKHRSSNTKEEISKKLKGRMPWMFGKKHSEKTKKKISKANSGEKSYLWQGGISKELYGFDWTYLLKHSIRTRDCFVCKICDKHGWIIHHIDYNKKNNCPENLITLCNSCHAKTNFKREYWIEYFSLNI